MKVKVRGGGFKFFSVVNQKKNVHHNETKSVAITYSPELLVGERERRAGHGLSDISKHVSIGHWTAQPCPQNQATRSTRAKLFPLPPNCNLLSFNQGDSSSERLCTLQVICSEGSITSPPILFGFKPFRHTAMTVTVTSGRGVVRSLNVLLLTLTGLSLSSPIRPTENRHRASVHRGDNPLLDAQDFLSHFLSTMNLTDLRLQPRPRKEPPEYMLELYNRFAHDHTAVPSGNIVRSFKNEGTDLLCFACTYFMKSLSSVLLFVQENMQI